MKLKIFAVFLLLCSLIVAGCVTDESGDAGENVSDANQSETSGEDNASTDMDNVTPSTDDETPANETPSNETPAEEEVGTAGNNGVSVVDSSGPKTYTINLKSYSAIPSGHTIDQGDSIFWINMNQPIRNFVLVSGEGLWENQNLGYRESFTYTFNETGNYTYNVLGYENRMTGTITVK
ncbi:MAG: hypothetical protein SCH66_14175 [Methanolobus sp.]|nr:hypothetical protein [Methanolobus sp.]